MSKVWNQSPVSMTELGIYLDWQKNPKGTAYNLPYLFPLPEGTDLDRLTEALRETLRAHPCVLAHFHMEEDGRVMRMTPAGDPEDLLIQIEEAEGEPDLNELIRPFPDPEGDLYRLCVMHGNGQAYLFADFHHILFDGFSTPVFVRELNRTYAGEGPAGEGETASDFARREQEARKTDAFELAGKWFEELLADSEISSAPIHDHEGGEPKNAWMELPLDLDAEKVRAKVKELGIRTSTFFTGVYGYLLSRFSGEKESLYASIRSDRDRENADSIGMFVKTFPVRERFDGKESIAEHLRDLEKQLLASWENRLFSYADINERFHLSIPTLFAYQGDMESEMDFLGGRLAPKLIQSDDPKNDVLLDSRKCRNLLFIC